MTDTRATPLARSGKAMEIKRAERFVKLGHDYFDTGIVTALGAPTFMVYMTIRRFMWGSLDQGSEAVRALMRDEGCVVARVSRDKLATHLAYRRKETISSHTRRLAHLGWIKPLKVGHPAQHVLGLGQWVPTGRGKSMPVFFADLWVNDLREHMGRRIRTEFGRDQEFTKVRLSKRLEIAQEYMRRPAKEHAELLLSRMGARANGHGRTRDS